MSKSRNIPDLTLDFFAPSFDPAPVIEAIRKTLKTSKKSREQIADLMSGYLARKITTTEIDSWAAPSKPGHLPRADELAALIWSAGSTEVIGAIAQIVRHQVIGPDDAQLLEIAKLEEARAEIDAEIALLRARRRGRK